jgi:hypothetical protein
MTTALDCSGPLRTWRYTVCVVGKGEGYAPPPTRALGQGRAPLREAPSRAGRPSLRNFGDSKLARICIRCISEPISRAASVGCWTRNVREHGARRLLCTVGS